MAKACFAEESFGEWSNTRTLSNEALVLRIGIAKYVIRVGLLTIVSAEYYPLTPDPRSSAK